MAPKTTDIIRGSEVEAEPVYKARVGRTLTVEVEVLVFTDVSEATEVELLWGTTPAVVLGLDESSAEEAMDTADEPRDLTGCTIEELLMPWIAVVAAPVVEGSDTEVTTGTTGKPRVLVTSFPPAVYVRVPVIVETEAKLESSAVLELAAALLDDTAGAISRLN
jgi:hypothetical protein